MIVTQSPGIILEKIKHTVISVPALLVRKNDFRICTYKSFHDSERKEDLNEFSFYFVQIPYTFTLKESSL
jgi:hypothetical protein